MGTMKLAKSDWHSYFDRLAKSLHASEVVIEVASLSMGDQVIAQGAALDGITYDPKGGDLTISTDRLEHRIITPVEIYLQGTAEALGSLEVLDNAGNKHIAKITPRLMIVGSSTK